MARRRPPQALFPDFGRGIAATCTTGEGAVVEAVLTDALVHCVVEDPIMFTETAVASLVEAQFEDGGAWTLGAATAETLEAEKQVLFKEYEKQVSANPPDCLRALRKMLQAGPVRRCVRGRCDWPQPPACLPATAPRGGQALSILLHSSPCTHTHTRAHTHTHTHI